MPNPIIDTKAGWWAVVPRLVAGGPLALFGIMKLVSADTQENFRVTLELASIPMVGVTMWVAALVEVVAGLMLLGGLLTRVGAALAVVQMLVALYVHVTVDFSRTPQGGPPHWLPIAVLLAALVSLVAGSGKLGLDHRIAGGGVREAGA